MKYLEDFAPGQVFHFRSAPMSAQSIKAFAQEWDPQRLHTDEDYATAIHGSLIASGFQTVLEVFKPVVTDLMTGMANIGGLGFDNLRWLLPVRPDEPLDPKASPTEVFCTIRSAPGTPRARSFFRLNPY